MNIFFTSATGQNQPHTQFQCEEQFNEAIRMILKGRHDKKKPLWTCERLGDWSTRVPKLKRTNEQYYYWMEVGNTKLLILKRKSASDSVVKIVPPEEFHYIFRETHQSPVGIEVEIKCCTIWIPEILFLLLLYSNLKRNSQENVLLFAQMSLAVSTVVVRLI